MPREVYNQIVDTLKKYADVQHEVRISVSGIGIKYAESGCSVSSTDSSHPVIIVLLLGIFGIRRRLLT